MSSTRRLDRILAIEEESRAQWDANKVYEVEAKNLTERNNTFFVTFPYPYMNGRLHLGHAFSLTKSEFRARFERLNGRHVLWCMAFHCTGMPIAASADKIRNELNDLANAPRLSEINVGPDADHCDAELNAVTVAGQAKVYTGKKSKVIAKSGNAKSQMEILRAVGVPENEIPEFADARHWLRYFPPLGKLDCHKFGVGVDWRRTFITTENNPYYDRFVRWQFTLLKERQRLKFGLRPAVFSRVEDQPCSDHDRSTGEGVGPLALNVLKLEVIDVSAKLAEILNQTGLPKLKPYLLALTAPQSANVIGKPQFFLNQDAEFGIYLALPKRLDAADLRESEHESFVARKRVSRSEALTICSDVFICEHHFAENMEYQGLLPSDPQALEPYSIGTLTSEEVSALKVRLNSTSQPESPSILTGQFVTSGKIEKGPRVNITSGQPSKDESPNAALTALENLKNEGLCLLVYEPEKPVVSRSGSECVVALCNQWYQDFGNREWKNLVLSHIHDSDKFECYGQVSALERAVEWFDGWACSRNYGLGTYLPWEFERGNKIVIESLSDSTIYWAYYTIAHYFQKDMFGSEPGLAGLTPEQCTRELFDYVFLQTDVMPDPKTMNCDPAVLREIRSSFEYWYPMDLRCSGKDLIGNHLTMALFNHAAIWPERRDVWPRAYYVNGFVCVDSKKMSKSEGNFLTIQDCVGRFSSDGTRVACADAGDSVEEANFEQPTAVAALMRLYNFQKDVEEFMEKKTRGDSPFRTGEKTDVDLMFEYESELLSCKARQAFATMQIRDANKNAFYEQLTLRDWYKNILGFQGREIHAESYEWWIRIVTVSESPIAPHVMEYVWSKLLNEPVMLAQSRWPECKFHTIKENRSRPLDPIVVTPNELGGSLHLRYMMLTQLTDDLRKPLEKARKSNAAAVPNVKIHCARTLPTSKCAVLGVLRQVDPVLLSGKSWVGTLKASPAMSNFKGKEMATLMGFAAYRAKLVAELGAEVALSESLPFEELSFWHEFSEFLNSSCNAKLVFDYSASESCGAVPGAPVFEVQI